MILEILRDECSESDYAEQEGDGRERVEDVDLVLQESLAAVNCLRDVVPSGLRHLNLLLFKPLGFGVLLGGEPLGEQGEEWGEDESHDGDHDEAEPPGAQPAALPLLQTALAPGDNIHLHSVNEGIEADCYKVAMILP